MALYKWNRFQCNEQKKWDTTKIATGNTAKLYVNGRMCFAKNEAEMADMMDVGDGQIHWNQESSFSSFTTGIDMSWYYASTSSAICTYYTKQYATTAYYAIITKKNTTLYANLTYDIYHVTNIRTEYSKGDAFDSVTSTSSSAYPNGARHSDGYWYEYVGEINELVGRITYGSSEIISGNFSLPVTVAYGGTTIATLSPGQTIYLRCQGSLMRHNIVVGQKTLVCANKVMREDVGITLAQ